MIRIHILAIMDLDLARDLKLNALMIMDLNTIALKLNHLDKDIQVIMDLDPDHKLSAMMKMDQNVIAHKLNHLDKDIQIAMGLDLALDHKLNAMMPTE